MTAQQEARAGARATVGRASLMLVVVTALWGASFTWTRSWQLAARDGPADELLSALTLIALRMPLALLLLGLWQPAVVLRPGRREHAGGLVLGAVFFAGFALQTWALAWTTPARSAFFTCLCSAWVPPLAYLFLRQRVAPLTLAGLALALAGCAVLVDGWQLGRGEWLTAAASVLFAAQVLVLDRLGRSLEAAHLSAGFLAATGLLALAGAGLLAAAGPGAGAWARWTAEMLGRPEVLRGLACQAVFATVLAFHWMNTYQPCVPAGRAALIYLLEPVFASLFSLLLGLDQPTYALLLGGLLIIGGNGLAALRPGR
jgi:drug/metabolite transporter (DMT)-like permease